MFGMAFLGGHSWGASSVPKWPVLGNNRGGGIVRARNGPFGKGHAGMLCFVPEMACFVNGRDVLSSSVPEPVSLKS